MLTLSSFIVLQNEKIAHSDSFSIRQISSMLFLACLEFLNKICTVHCTVIATTMFVHLIMHFVCLSYFLCFQVLFLVVWDAQHSGGCAVFNIIQTKILINKSITNFCVGKLMMSNRQRFVANWRLSYSSRWFTFYAKVSSLAYINAWFI